MFNKVNSGASRSSPSFLSWAPTALYSWSNTSINISSNTARQQASLQRWRCQATTQVSAGFPPFLDSKSGSYRTIQDRASRALPQKDTLRSLRAAGTSIVLSFQLGNCTFDSDWTQTKEIECEQPSLVYIKSPAVLTAPYKTPVSFTDQVSTEKLVTNTTANALALCALVEIQHGPMLSWS